MFHHDRGIADCCAMVLLGCKGEHAGRVWQVSLSHTTNVLKRCEIESETGERKPARREVEAG